MVIKFIDWMNLKEFEKSKDETKDHFNIIFLGNIDTGKTTIEEYILYAEEQNIIELFKKEGKEQCFSYFHSYLEDSKKEKGVKFYSKNQFKTPKKRFTVFQSPGFKNYQPNFSNLRQSDIAILVVSAKKGEFEIGFEKGGKTCEYAILAKVMGIKKLIIAVNKMDDSSVNWSKERYDDIQNILSKFLIQEGFDLNKQVLFLPTSGLKGININERIKDNIFPSYEGESLIDILDDLNIPNIYSTLSLRIPIIDKYKEN